MKTTPILTALLLVHLLLVGCNDVGSPVDDAELIEIRPLVVSLYANLEPPPPPDPIICTAIVIVQNTGTTTSITGLSIPAAEVRLDSSGQLSGMITFSTAWDGSLSPLEKDTVRLEKIRSEVPLFEPPCSAYVRLRFLIKKDAMMLKNIDSDNLLFNCVQ